MRSSSTYLDALFPRTRQNILSTLVLQPERRWYLSDLAHHLNVPSSSLQRELASLAEAGVLRREEDGNRVYFQADPTFPLAAELRGIFVKTTGAVALIAEALRPFEANIETAFLFGSYARSEQKAHSDVDLMLVGDIRMASLSLPLHEVEDKISAEVNVMLYSIEELKEKWRGGNHFIHTIMSGPKIFLKGTEDELAVVIGERQGAASDYEQVGVG